LERFIATHSERCRTAIAVLEELVPSGDVEIAEPSPNGQVIEEKEEVAADL